MKCSPFHVVLSPLWLSSSAGLLQMSRTTLAGCICRLAPLKSTALATSVFLRAEPYRVSARFVFTQMQAEHSDVCLVGDLAFPVLKLFLVLEHFFF